MKDSIRFLLAVTGCALTLAPVDRLQAIVLNTEVSDGGVVDDGNGDIYDDFGHLNVNGMTYSGTVSGADPVYSLAAENLGGIVVTGQVSGIQSLGLDGADTDFRFVRWWFTLTNTSSAPAPVDVVFGGELGSDSDTTTTASFGRPMRWVITADAPVSEVPSDPAVGHVFASSQAAIVPIAYVIGDEIHSTFSMTIAPGATLSLVFFATARNVTGSNAGDSITADVLSDLNGVLFDSAGNVQTAFLQSGLASTSTVVNHSFADGNTRISGIRAKVRANGTVDVRGRASSTFGIAKVDFFVGNLTGKARGTRQWRFRADSNRPLKVQATDLTGGTTRKIPVRIRRTPSRP